jgi:hypothetical protein
MFRGHNVMVPNYLDLMVSGNLFGNFLRQCKGTLNIFYNDKTDKGFKR